MKPPTLIALLREVSPRMVECELTHQERVVIDAARAREQHANYAKCLAALGCDVRLITPTPELPDSVFVEDTAVVLDEIAVVTRPGAESRRAESASVCVALRSYRPVRFLEAPATLDGGDVLRVGRTFYVGRSSRSNAEGVRQLAAAIEPHGYVVKSVTVNGCLHLKTAATCVAEGVLLLNPRWVDGREFGEMELIEVDASEPSAANALRVSESVIYPAAFPNTRARLEQRALDVRVVDLSEFAKAEGGVTCCSLILRV